MLKPRYPILTHYNGVPLVFLGQCGEFDVWYDPTWDSGMPYRLVWIEGDGAFTLVNDIWVNSVVKHIRSNNTRHYPVVNAKPMTAETVAQLKQFFKLYGGNNPKRRKWNPYGR